MEKPWFKFAIFGGGSLLILIIASIFFLDYMHDQEERRRLEAQRLEEMRAYQDRYRSQMNLVIKNLRIDHFLAAHEIIDQLEEPPEWMGREYREYNETLMRIAKGLFDRGFLDDAEPLFKSLQRKEEYFDESTEHLQKIAATRRLSSAQEHFESGKKLLKEGKFRDAASEFRKTNVELNAVELFNVHDVSEVRKELQDKLARALHHIHLAGARFALEDARVYLKKRFFEETRKALTKAHKHVAKARFFRAGNPEVQEVREQIFDVDGELAFLAPNAVPVWNRKSPERVTEFDNFFFMEDYEFDLQPGDPASLKLGMNYRMHLADAPFFVVRYKVFYFNGQHFFNGHFVEEPRATGIDKSAELEFEQEVPEALRDEAVKRIDFHIYNHKNELVSRVSRAFRKPGVASNSSL